MGADTGELNEEALEKSRPMDVDKFAAKALDRIPRNPEIIILPWGWGILDWIDRNFPSLLGGSMTRRFTREHARMQKLGDGES